MIRSMLLISLFVWGFIGGTPEHTGGINFPGQEGYVETSPTGDFGMTDQERSGFPSDWGGGDYTAPSPPGPSAPSVSQGDVIKGWIISRIPGVTDSLIASGIWAIGTIIVGAIGVAVSILTGGDKQPRPVKPLPANPKVEKPSPSLPPYPDPFIEGILQE